MSSLVITCIFDRHNPEHIFEVFCEVGSPPDSNPFILTKFPEDFGDQEVLKSIPSFAYPCLIHTDNVMHFSFVLTAGDSKWTFGFVRLTKSAPCLLILSSLPWHEAFYKTLNHISSLMNKQDGLFVTKFLDSLYNLSIPEPGLPLVVNYYVNAREYEFSTPCPDHLKVPSIPEDRNLTEYFNAIDSNNMMIIFASMLNERRILMTSRRLSRLTSCVQAANALIYPMYWQHIFIPVLPPHLMDYLLAPMPFLIGVPAETMARVKRHELGDVVILDADDNRIESPFDDLHMLPTEIISFLKKSLRPQNHLLGDAVSRTFLKALVMLIGGYRDALSFPQGKKITFNKEVFVSSRPAPMQPFLERMLQLQIFQQFIEGRLLMLHEGKGFNDEFEFELNLHEDRSANRLKNQYNEWLFEIKKEGSAIIKSVNPVVRNAYRQVKQTGRHVKDKSKQAYRGIRSKIQNKSRQEQSVDVYGNSYRRPRSAPSSPTGSPVNSRRDWNARNPTGGSAGEVKKSISGVIVEKTEKTATYVRGRPNTIHNGALKAGVSAGPSLRNETSPQNGDIIEFGVEATEVSPPKTSLIDLDVLGELSQVFASNVSFNPFENMLSQHTTLESSFENPSVLKDPFSPVMEKSASFGNFRPDLIGLDSPPKELALFDPLHQEKSQGKTSGISGTVAEINGLSSNLPTDFSTPFTVSSSVSQNTCQSTRACIDSLALPRPPVSSRTSKCRLSPSMTSTISKEPNTAGKAMADVKPSDSLLGLEDPFNPLLNGSSALQSSQSSSQTRSWQLFE